MISTSNLLQARALEVASLIFRLLTADHETTTSLLANGFGRLLTERAGWEEICRDPVLILNAVEEIHEDGYVDSRLAKQNHGVNRNREHRGSP